MMTGAKEELLARHGLPGVVPGEDADLWRRAERRGIGRQLHQGILQELTVAGLRLKTLGDTAPDPTAAAIAEFAAWLRDRQAELRQIVTELEQGRPVDSKLDLSAIAAELHERYGCQLSFDPQSRLGQFGPDVWSAMIDTVQGLAQILATGLSARHIEVGTGDLAQPILRIIHDGRSLADRADQLVALRAMVGRRGASLHVDRAGNAERLTLDWAR